MDRGAWQATVGGVTRVGYDLVTKPPPSFLEKITINCPKSGYSFIVHSELEL